MCHLNGDEASGEGGTDELLGSMTVDSIDTAVLNVFSFRGLLIKCRKVMVGHHVRPARVASMCIFGHFPSKVDPDLYCISALFLLKIFRFMSGRVKRARNEFSKVQTVPVLGVTDLTCCMFLIFFFSLFICSCFFMF